MRYGSIYDDLRDYAKRYDEVVVDAGGRDSEELAGHKAADALISHYDQRKRTLDVSHLAKLVKMARSLNPQLISQSL